MKHVRLTLDAEGNEAAIHPMYDALVTAPYIEQATAMHWTFTGSELGIMHYIEGDREAFKATLEAVPEVLAYELVPAGEEAFYAYVRDATNEPLRTIFDSLTQQPVVPIPPLEYADGVITCSLFGPAEAVQQTIEAIPEPIMVTVTEITGLAGTPGVLESLLSVRQREALEAAATMGYYDIPRTASHEAIAEAIGCAPSTAAEHLRKAESTLLRSLIGN